MMARPNEIKAVTAVLMDPADDVKDVAKAAIHALDKAREDRTDYVVVSQSGGLAHGIGLYPTYAAAAKAIEMGKIRSLDGARLFVLPVITPKVMQDRADYADQPAMSEDAQRVWTIARNGGQQARTPSRRNRRR